MAYIGLRKPIMAARKGYKSYDVPFAFGKAIGLTVAPVYAEGSLHADDAQSEYDKEFTSADVSLNTDTIPIAARTSVFGHETNEEEIVFNADDEAGYVALGWISVEKIDGKRKFTGNFLPKVKFTEPSEEYATKGENIEYKTPSISGKALVEEEDGVWKNVQPFDTATEALEYIYEKMGYTIEKLTVESAEGTEAGKTKLTVTPEKTGDNSYIYRLDKDPQIPVFDTVCKNGYSKWDGTAEITAKEGDKILVVEVTEEGKARKAGIADVALKKE